MFINPAADPISSNPPTRPAQCSHCEGGENKEMTTSPQTARPQARLMQAARLRLRCPDRYQQHPEVLNQEIEADQKIVRVDVMTPDGQECAWQCYQKSRDEESRECLGQHCGAEHRRPGRLARLMLQRRLHPRIVRLGTVAPPIWRIRLGESPGSGMTILFSITYSWT